jgi:hypothetical protein
MEIVVTKIAMVITLFVMEHNAFEFVNNCWNTKVTFHLVVKVLIVNAGSTN